MLKNSSILLILLSFFSLISCKKENSPEFKTWVPYDETGLIKSNENNESEQLRYKLIQSKVSDRNELITNITSQLSGFSEEKYMELSPLILDQDIQTLQDNISDEKFSYKELTQWYLYRIAKFESDKDLSLNAMISINPEVVMQAERLDNSKSSIKHPIYGMPVILKDNINTKNMPTTAGAVALKNNQPETEAEIVANLKSYKGLVLGKANLSEWANFLCDGCPNGYSAIGGQTLNPYGVREFDTGGSSSGSAVAIAANYAAAAVGSETSGSILSPSSQQSAVGLKPTVGILSQDGIVPISSTLDTPGPITRNLKDNSILFSAMASAYDKDFGSKVPWEIQSRKDLKGVRLGAYKSYMQNSLYQKAIEDLRNLGAEVIEIDPEAMNFEGFLELLSGDMKIDLKKYLSAHASENIKVKTASDVMKFNFEDTTTRIPYGQARFEGIEDLDITEDELVEIRRKLLITGINYFEKPMIDNNLDAILSINNYNAGQAAAAKFPALTVPMGYNESGEPEGLTFITKPYQESEIYSYANLYEEVSKKRKSPEKYLN
ncbi:amidase family protein [Psychroflexus lacisalsi]|jgi:amidase|uniref:Amidase family protein n=1 Tax=Psychroflexus lacisalsi TaxID=503928 RepID=A0ABN1K6D3_9FLAO|nr:amidase family protein [Psychroflexus lacisalsi]MBZ9619269.1 amidase [Psychroflexus lacisalsi]